MKGNASIVRDALRKRRSKELGRVALAFFQRDGRRKNPRAAPTAAKMLDDAEQTGGLPPAKSVAYYAIQPRSRSVNASISSFRSRQLGCPAWR